MPFSGDVTILDAKGEIDKATFRDRFLIPVAQDIERLQSGVDIAFSSIPTGLPQLGDEMLFRSATDQAAFFTSSGAAAAIANRAVRNWHTAGELSIPDDGAVDASAAFQRTMDALSAAGGGMVFMQSASPLGFVFRGRPRLPSNLNVIWGSPIRAAKHGGLRIEGRFALVADRDNFGLLESAAVDAAQLRIDTTPHGGGALSSCFTVGDWLLITGRLDAAGTFLEQVTRRVTGIDDATQTLTLSGVLPYAFQQAYPAGDYEGAWGAVNRTLVGKLDVAALTADAPAQTAQVTIGVADAARFAVDDWVIAEDQTTAGDLVTGGSTSLVHRLPVQIAAIDGGAITLSSYLQHPLTVSRFARLTRIIPSENTSTSGARVIFTETPDPAPADPIDTFTVRLAANCTMFDATVANDDIYGSRGAMFRCNLSSNCGFQSPRGLNPKYYAGSGEGYGLIFAYGNQCWADDPELVGCTVSVLFQSSVSSNVTDLLSRDCRLRDVLFNGTRSIGCRVRLRDLSAGALTASATRTGVTFGATDHKAGDVNCWVSGGRISSYLGSGGQAVVVYAGTKDCGVEGTSIENVRVALYAADMPGAGTQIVDGFGFLGNEVTATTDYAVYLDGDANGATGRILESIRIVDNEFRRSGRFIFADQAKSLRIAGNIVDNVVPDGTEPYFVRAIQCDNLTVSDNQVYGARGGVSTQLSPNGQVTGNTFRNLATGTVYNDGGGNDGTVIAGNICTEFEPTIGRSGGSVLCEAPRTLGAVTIADDAVWKMKPLRLSGTLTITAVGAAPWADFLFKTGASPTAPVKRASDATSWAMATGALTGATGTDGNVTVSTHTDGLIYIENRRGSALTIEVHQG